MFRACLKALKIPPETNHLTLSAYFILYVSLMSFVTENKTITTRQMLMTELKLYGSQNKLLVFGHIYT